MNEEEEFWMIATNSGVVDPAIGLALQDLLNIMQAFTEAASWITHRISVGIDNEGTFPRYLDNTLMAANESAREIIHVLSKCSCKGCRDLYGDQ